MVAKSIELAATSASARGDGDWESEASAQQEAEWLRFNLRDPAGRECGENGRGQRAMLRPQHGPLGISQSSLHHLSPVLVELSGGFLLPPKLRLRVQLCSRWCVNKLWPRKDDTTDID